MLSGKHSSSDDLDLIVRFATLLLISLKRSWLVLKLSSLSSRFRLVISSSFIEINDIIKWRLLKQWQCSLIQAEAVDYSLHKS
jgi:hypothetical protein